MEQQRRVVSPFASAQPDDQGEQMKTLTAATGGDPLRSMLPAQPPAVSGETDATGTALVTVTSVQPLSPVPADVLGDDGRRVVDAALAGLDVSNLRLQDVILLGTEAQDALGKHIDELLGMVSRKDAPVLYELFEELQGSLKKVNLDELEATVRKGQGPGWLAGLTDWLRLTNPAKRMKRVADQLRGMLDSKSQTLLTLVNGMETKAKEEVQRLVTNLGMLDKLALGYLASVKGFGIATAIGYELLGKAREHERLLANEANRTRDPQDIAAARNYSGLVEQLQNRALTLRTAYEQVPGELMILSVAKGAASTTLTETANGIRQEFNDLKSALVKWHVLLSIQELQASNEHRRQIAISLRKHNLTVLERVATTAATLQGENRLQDAQLLLGIAEGLGGLRDKLKGLADERKAKFEQAEQALSKARSIFASPRVT